jgi:hypothetical protein
MGASAPQTYKVNVGIHTKMIILVNRFRHYTCIREVMGSNLSQGLENECPNTMIKLEHF